MDDCKIRGGYRVLGLSSLGVFTVWNFPTEKDAMTFAKQMSQDTGCEYDICKYLGSWKVPVQPVEFVPATDLQKENADG